MHCEELQITVADLSTVFCLVEIISHIALLFVRCGNLFYLECWVTIEFIDRWQKNVANIMKLIKNSSKEFVYCSYNNRIVNLRNSMKWITKQCFLIFIINVFLIEMYIIFINQIFYPILNCCKLHRTNLI